MTKPAESVATAADLVEDFARVGRRRLARSAGRLGFAMKFALACYGTRGDVEPSVAVGRELLRRGHEVRMAVPPDLVGLRRGGWAGGGRFRAPDVQAFWTRSATSGRISSATSGRSRVRSSWCAKLGARHRRWAEMSTTLTALADGADLLLTGVNFEQAAANVAEYYDIPLATLHHFPHAGQRSARSHPAGAAGPLRDDGVRMAGLAQTKKPEDEQRRELGLPKATRPSPRRIAERGSLEIQAYDAVCFPGLAAEWAKWDGRRPFVGALTMELTTDADDGGRVVDCRGNTADLLRLRQHAGRISGRHGRNDQRGLRAVRRAGVDVRRRDRLQRRTAFRTRQGGGRGELRGDLSRLPRGRPPRRLGHHGRGPARRDPHADPLEGPRSAVLGSSRQTAEGGHRPALFDHYPGIADRRPARDPGPAIRRPGPRDRDPDHQTRRKRCGAA